VAGLIPGLGGGFIPPWLRRGFDLETSYLHLLLHFSEKTVLMLEMIHGIRI
jgi:hypothetical protein